MAIQTLSFISLILRPYVKQPISTDGWKIVLIATMLFTLGNQATAHSGGLNKQGCHADSKPYHCHRGPSAAPKASSGPTTINGSVTHVRDGDTIEVNGIAVRLSALDCPENDTRQGQAATKLAKQFVGLQADCELTGAKSYDRVVGYCSVGGPDFGLYMMQNSACKVWPKYDVWNRY
jgi:endonuclease YncB( thermonuclease family)